MEKLGWWYDSAREMAHGWKKKKTMMMKEIAKQNDGVRDPEILKGSVLEVQRRKQKKT